MDSRKRSLCSREDSAEIGVSPQQSKSCDSPGQKSEPSTKRHPFATHVLDHCETPRVAYEHLQCFLKLLAEVLKIKPADKLKIWDPYYCDGSTKRILEEIGYANVINENVDFYETIKEKMIPEHDVLVTNPPYSGDHIVRLFEFIATRDICRKVPCCLLLPNWVSRQPDYAQKFIKPIEDAHQELFHLSPVQSYTYAMPLWVSERDRPRHVGSDGQTTPYLSSWYIVVPSNATKNGISLLDHMDKVAKRQTQVEWIVAKTVKGLKWKIQRVNQKQCVATRRRTKWKAKKNTQRRR